MMVRRFLSAVFNSIHLAACGVALAIVSSAAAQEGEYLTGITWPEPPVVTPGKTNSDPPSDAIVLFDGKDLSAWENGEKWKIEDGVATVQGGEITTKQSFGDIQLHIEWSSPVPATGSSQGRGNSGVFLMDRYELQVLDSYDNETYFDGQAGGIYKQTPPLVNAMHPPGEWNTYDIIWTAPKFKEDGSLESPAYITALHNGVLILNHFQLSGNTPFNSAPKYEAHGKLPISLQDHGNPVRYRNIWVREIKPIVGKQEREPFYRDGNGKEWPAKKKTSANQGGIQLDEDLLPTGTIRLSEKGGNAAVTAPVIDGRLILERQPVPAGKAILTIGPPITKPARQESSNTKE
jgi:hypothetical protein